MPPNQISLENLHLNPFYNESFSDIEDERDPDENIFNEFNTQNFECSYLFPNEIGSSLSEKENCETINAIIVKRNRKIVRKHGPKWSFFALMLRTKLY